MKGILKITAVLCLVFLFPIGLQAVAKSVLEQRLNNLPYIKVEKISTLSSFKESFKIYVKQPVDHSDTTKGYFYQKIYLSHKDTAKPMVLYINGYIAFNNSPNEWSEVLDANQVFVEYRYFGESRPDEIIWETLSMRNAVADLHHIRTILGQIYNGSWVSTGISKGGLTSLAYKYHYPDDVDATIALSSAIKTSDCDTLFFNYIDSLNRAQNCPDKIEQFQRQLLDKKNEIIPLLTSEFEKNEKQFNELGINKVFELAVLELPFAIWQHKSGCISLYVKDTTASGLLNSLQKATYHWFLTDNIVHALQPQYYQLRTELGYYCYPTSKFRNLLSTTQNNTMPATPELNINCTYSNSYMQELKIWLMNEGNNIIYINGLNDPYSLYRLIPGENTNSMALALNNCNHNQTWYHNLGRSQQESVMELLKKWMK